VIRPFAGKTPYRTIALVWRNSSALGDFHNELAKVFRQLTADLFK
jgi:hypothetical protein